MTIPVLTQVTAEPMQPANAARTKGQMASADTENAKPREAFADVLRQESASENPTPDSVQRETAPQALSDESETELVSKLEDKVLAKASDTPKDDTIDVTAIEAPVKTESDAERPRKAVVIPDLPAEKPVSGALPIEQNQRAERTDKIAASTPVMAPNVTTEGGQTKQVAADVPRVIHSATTPPDGSKASEGGPMVAASGANKALETSMHVSITQKPARPEFADGSLAVPQNTKHVLDVQVPVDRANSAVLPNATEKPSLPPQTAQAIGTRQAGAMFATSESTFKSARFEAHAETTESQIASLPKPVAPTTQPATQPILAQQIAAFSPGAQMVAKESKIQPLHSDGELEALHFETRVSQSTSTTPSTAVTPSVARSDIPRAIALQISEAARAMSGGSVDISLSPEELGRVRLSISASESGVVLNVLAERPETLDLMRRNAEQLARELADIGFTSVELAFGKGEGDAAEGDRDPETPHHSNASGVSKDTDEIQPSSTKPSASIMLDGSGGLDIRI